MSNLRKVVDATSTFYWVGAVFVLSVWPFVSFVPLVEIFSRGATIFDVTINSLFVLTSFVGVFGAYVFVMLSLSNPAHPWRDAMRGRLALPSAAYGTLWLIAYTAYEILRG